MVSFLVFVMISSSSLIFLSFSSRVTAFSFWSFSHLTSSRHCRTYLVMSVKRSSVLFLSRLLDLSSTSCSALNFFRSSLFSLVTVVSACFLTLSWNEVWSCAIFSFIRTSNPWILLTPSAMVFSDLTTVVAFIKEYLFAHITALNRICTWLAFQRVQNYVTNACLCCTWK